MERKCNLVRYNENLKDPNRKRQLNREMFAIIAPKYARITRILSFGRDRYWKQDLLNSLPHLATPFCLDIACGPGDITQQLALRFPKGRVIGIDICPEMLKLAEPKSLPNCQYILADMVQPPIADNSIDIVTGGYALRNAPNLKELLKIIYQKLKPGGAAAFLDFSKPVNLKKASLQHQVLKFWTRSWGLAFNNNADVYAYIAESLALFPNEQELRSLIIETGFSNYSRVEYLGGFTSLMNFKK